MRRGRPTGGTGWLPPTSTFTMWFWHLAVGGNMSAVDYLQGKYRAATRLGEFVRYLRNWPEVWSAFQGLHHSPRSASAAVGNWPAVRSTTYTASSGRSSSSAATPGGSTQPRPDHTVVDVGANVGVFAVFMHWQALGITLHCLEPVRATRERLQANLERNRVVRATVHPLAVSDSEGSLTLYHGHSAGHSSPVPSRFTGGRAETVRCIDLRTALAETGAGRIDLLKIDTEGAEVDILQGVTPDVVSRVARIVVEYHGIIRPGCREVVMAAMRRLGFGQVDDVPDLPDGQLGLVRGIR